MILCEKRVKRIKHSVRFIMYLCDRAAANNISRSVRYTEAGIATVYGLEDSDWVGEKVYSVDTQHPSNLLYNGYHGSYLGVKRPGCDLATYHHLCVLGVLQGDIYL
jgi:hypothetical protein